MKKIFLALLLVGLGGCIQDPPPSSDDDEPVQEEISEEETQEEVTVEITQEPQATPPPMTGDTATDQQNQAEYYLYMRDIVKSDAEVKTKPISYEKAVIRDPLLKKKFLQTWHALDQNPGISVDDPQLDFIQEQYQALLNHSKNCCMSGIASELDRASMEKDDIYAFLKDDYNFYRAGELCYFYSDRDLEQIFTRSEDIRAMIKKVRHNCLCLNYDRLKEKTTVLNALLSHQNINGESLFYRSYDEFGRETRRHMFSDVQNIDSKLRCCPEKK